MDRKQLEPALQNFADHVIGRVNEHTTKAVNDAVDRAVEELADITARSFRGIEKRLDKVEDKLDAMENKSDSHFEDIKGHLIAIDDRIGLRPRFEFREE